MTPIEIRKTIKEFREDNPDSKRTGFLMMRFSESTAHKKIATQIKAAFKKFGLKVLRADDHQYGVDLFANIQTYMHGCGFGVVVFERLEEESFNPNIALELGYMVALHKRVMVLKDSTIKVLPADLMGRLYLTFDTQQLAGTISAAVERWVKDTGLVTQTETLGITNLERILLGSESPVAWKAKLALRRFRPNRKGAGKMGLPGI